MPVHLHGDDVADASLEPKVDDSQVAELQMREANRQVSFPLSH